MITVIHVTEQTKHFPWRLLNKMSTSQDSTVPKHHKTNAACCNLQGFIGALDHLIFSYTSHALSFSQKVFKYVAGGLSHLSNSKQVVIKKGRRKSPRIVYLSPT